MKKVSIRRWVYITEVVLALQFSIGAGAQTVLPVIRTGNGPVDIRDGWHLKQGYWQVMPDRRPDYYYVEIPEQSHAVTFITDQDSIRFNVEFGKNYDFIILRNGKDSCYTRIVASYKNNRSLLPSAMPGEDPDTLHFHLGKNRKLYLDGFLNGSEVRNCQLDLGAGGIIINESSIPKVHIHFDQKTTLANSDGVNEVPLSNFNQLKIGNLTWDSLPVLVAKNMQPAEDLLLSNALFKNKVLEINYDKKLLIVRDKLPADISTYKRLDMLLDQDILPFIPVRLHTHDSAQSGWVMFDTGAWTTIINSKDAGKGYQMMVQLASLAGLKNRLSPTLIIGSYQMTGFHYKTRDMGGGSRLSLILGVDMLRRFNMVLDNRHGYIYLKPNLFWDAPYAKPDEYYVLRVAVAVILILIIFLVYQRSKKRTRQ